MQDSGGVAQSYTSGKAHIIMQYIWLVDQNITYVHTTSKQRIYLY